MRTTAAPSLRFTRRARAAVAAAVMAGLLTGCVPATSDGGQLIVSTDDRIFQIRTARIALATPVPALVAEVDRFVGAVETIWTTGDGTRARGQLAGTLDAAPLRVALAALVAAGPIGDGPDMRAARSAVGQIATHVNQLAAGARSELDELGSLGAWDDKLAQMVVAWDAPGSRNGQLEAFAQLAVQATSLATELAAQTETIACTEVYERRAGVAELLAERTLSLRALVAGRQGLAFDELRRGFHEDPFGLGSSLGEADRAAATRCWRLGSPTATAPDELARLVDALGDTLDPAELRG